MAKFTAPAVRSQPYDAALASQAGQIHLNAMNRLGQNIGQGLGSAIGAYIKKNREDKQLEAMTNTILPQVSKMFPDQFGGEDGQKNLKSALKSGGLPQLLSLEQQKAQSELQAQKKKIGALQLQAAYTDRNKSELANHGFTTGSQVRNYITRNSSAALENIDIENDDPASIEQKVQQYSAENPLTRKLLEASQAGATDDDLLRMYRGMTGRGGIGVSQQNIGNKTVTFQTDATGTPTEIIPASSLGNNYGGGAGMQRKNYGPDGNVTSYTQINADGSEGQTTFVHTNEPGSPLANLQNAQDLAGTSEDTIESVYLRQMVPFNPQTISPQDLNKITTEASQKAGVDRKGFVDMVNKNLNADTTKLFTKGLQVGSKTLQLLDVAVSNDNLPSLQGAIKSFITQVEDGIVTDDEFQRFSDLGLFENFKKKFDEAGGRVTEEVAKELRTAALGLVEFSHNRLEPHIASIKQQAMRTYDKIPSGQAERLARTSVDTELSNAKMLLEQKLKLPEGVTQNMGKITVRGVETASGDISEVPLDVLVGQLGGKYTKAKLVEGLQRAYSDEVIQYLLKHIPTKNEE